MIDRARSRKIRLNPGCGKKNVTGNPPDRNFCSVGGGEESRWKQRDDLSKALTAAIRAGGVGMAVGRMETVRPQTQQKGTRGCDSHKSVFWKMESSEAGRPGLRVTACPKEHTFIELGTILRPTSPRSPKAA